MYTHFSYIFFNIFMFFFTTIDALIIMMGSIISSIINTACVQ